MEIAIGATRHSVVKEVGQVGGAAIEGDRQFTAGVVVAKQHLGKGCATLFATIPPLEDSIARLQFGNHRDGRAGAVDKNDALTCLMECSQQLSLYLWQFDAGAIATLKTRFADTHLLTLKTG